MLSPNQARLIFSASSAAFLCVLYDSKLLLLPVFIPKNLKSQRTQRTAAEFAENLSIEMVRAKPS